MAGEWRQGGDCDWVKEQRRNRPRIAKKKKKKKVALQMIGKYASDLSQVRQIGKKKSEGYYVSFIILP